MKIIGFIGPSGTGKSHRALWVARERGIEYIIDDGLLINGNKVIAGVSAKKEGTRIASIKRALLTDKNHAEEMKRAFRIYNIHSVLILGTSDEMVDAIAKKLELPSVSEKVHIEDVATELEIKRALSTRKEKGKHVIPVPTFEIKKDFSGYFLDPLHIFKRKGRGNFQLIGEKSVVRPTFSYRGKYTISDYTVYQICTYIALSFEEITRVSRFRAENHPDGLYIEMDLVLVYGCIIRNVLSTLQIAVREEIDRLTALNIKSINLVARSLVVNK